MIKLLSQITHHHSFLQIKKNIDTIAKIYD